MTIRHAKRRRVAIYIYLYPFLGVKCHSHNGSGHCWDILFWVNPALPFAVDCCVLIGHAMATN